MHPSGRIDRGPALVTPPGAIQNRSTNGRKAGSGTSSRIDIDVSTIAARAARWQRSSRRPPRAPARAPAVPRSVTQHAEHRGPRRRQPHPDHAPRKPPGVGEAERARLHDDRRDDPEQRRRSGLDHAAPDPLLPQRVDEREAGSPQRQRPGRSVRNRRHHIVEIRVQQPDPAQERDRGDGRTHQRAEHRDPPPGQPRHPELGPPPRHDAHGEDAQQGRPLPRHPDRERELEDRHEQRQPPGWTRSPRRPQGEPEREHGRHQPHAHRRPRWEHATRGEEQQGSPEHEPVAGHSLGHPLTTLGDAGPWPARASGLVDARARAVPPRRRAPPLRPPPGRPRTSTRPSNRWTRRSNASTPASLPACRRSGNAAPNRATPVTASAAPATDRPIPRPSGRRSGGADS